jgi:phage-related protein
MKPLEFLGSSRDDLRAMPAAVRRGIGSELMRAHELQTDAAKFEAGVYVLHAFRKKSQRTAKADIELAKARYRMIGGKS